ncbi:unnamed protein product [Phaedon cochleariae]|uniref:Protein-lysine N-methyltransferase SMYD4 n=1 Tax=Phaedon cochleariae TaxID=80249 RepID=A0A9P0GPG1_PHACE|nr:unnamed protein product [Phaedon cochleariae]
MTDTNRNVVDAFKDLLRHLADDRRYEDATQQFSLLKTNGDRVQFVHGLLDGYMLFPAFLTDKKSDAIAFALRQRGNEMFKRRNNKLALDLYTESLCYAEKESENKSLAFANRSAVLFEKEMYTECLMDIERALNHNYPDHLKPKLLNRREKAELLETTQANLQYHQPLPEIPEDSRNSHIDCASKSICIESTKEKGRHIIATSDIHIGDIIAIENPFCCMLINEPFCHCHECLRLCYNLIPCGYCTQTLYCSEDCRENAQLYHQYECKILKTLKALQLDKMKLLPLKLALVAKQNYKQIGEWKLDASDAKEEKYHSDRYKEVHHLVGNTESRSVADLFARATTGAIIYQLVKVHTNFFEGEEEESIFRELILLHLQTAACNFHEVSEFVEKDSEISQEEIGAGAYSFLSLFNHSCSPNVVRHCYGPIIVLRAIENIKKGEECYDNYGYHYALMSKPERRINLKQQYFFECSCTVCLDDWPLLEHLPIVKTDIGIDEEDLSLLRKGDLKCSRRVLREILPRMGELEELRPNRNHAEMQEVVKQCFACFGNVRRTF